MTGHTVRESRLVAGLSLRELARRIGVSPATLSAIETGRTGLEVGRLHDIAAALGTTPDRLLAPGRGPAPPPDETPPPGSAADWRTFAPLPIDPVLAAAITAFVRTGYHGATMRSIARLARMSVPGVYHHYRSKQELLVTTLDLTMADLIWRMHAADREALGDEHSRGGVARVRLMVQALALFHTHRRELAAIGASEMRGLEPANRRRIAGLRNDVQHLLDTAIDHAIADGDLHTTSPRHAGRAIATMCTSLTQWFRPTGPDTPERIAIEYARFALGLLGHRNTTEHRVNAGPFGVKAATTIPASPLDTPPEGRDHECHTRTDRIS
ncbi:TetR family transcriptional regulator [Pseudonocardia acaciae]|uniref:TetR family transcriptional regulator n=1 Tax=Pseudonocardia acaciae TaxID=551276 RepID=UPI0007E8E97C|nr:TetR family transcriptional regulator [Pseudonocardia acaciae]